MAGRVARLDSNATLPVAKQSCPPQHALAVGVRQAWVFANSHSAPE